MKAMTKRILTTVVTLPLMFFIIVFLPHFSYIALSLLAVATAIFATSELKTLYKKTEKINMHFPSFVVGILPLAQWLQIAYYPHLPLVDLAVVTMALAFFSTEIFYGVRDDFSKTFSRIGGESLLLLYPGLLITFIQRLTAVQHPSQSLLLFFLLVFGNDVFAFLFGMSFGRNNKGLFQVSPNKSLAGFLGGTISTIVLAVLFCVFVPGIKEDVSILQAIVLGLLTSVAANIGDLIESAFKRCADVKDSGCLIPGRGGLLDSIDSMLAAAPVFWVVLSLF